ncbi:hypothetical protein UFOVP142_69 [uncultured Caudovirales phage]|uniref:Uncharacterized protein n=1 Tax=uncultured Caudovirales phage TaxID=2100421 RepID=A0A6J7XUL6_9CAUD|nr:hypothetical protein UFOVP142_69 [uncultured Caudovirales phage]
MKSYEYYEIQRVMHTEENGYEVVTDKERFYEAVENNVDLCWSLYGRFLLDDVWLADCLHTGIFLDGCMNVYRTYAGQCADIETPSFGLITLRPNGKPLE